MASLILQDHYLIYNERGCVPIRYLDMSPLGDCAIMVKLGDRVDPETNHNVRAFADYLANHSFDGMVEYVPAFTSVTVFYDPMRVHLLHNRKDQVDNLRYPFHIVEGLLKEMFQSMNELAAPKPHIVEIPVCYDEEFGVDLAHVAAINGLRTDDVIRIHSSGEYLVYMLGFAPGFPYLGGMDKRIAAPRRESPRLKIPQGTVGIAGEQTGVYPIETPGGWQLIGRTPLSLFVPMSHPPTLLEAGNVIRFYPISRKEYDTWRE